MKSLFCFLVIPYAPRDGMFVFQPFNCYKSLIILFSEKLPCDHYLRIFAPELFEHCTSESSNCIYKNEWSTWSEEKLGKKYVKVPKQKCGSEKIRVISRHRNADSGTNCTPETDSKEDCELEFILSHTLLIENGTNLLFNITFEVATTQLHVSKI